MTPEELQANYIAAVLYYVNVTTSDPARYFGYDPWNLHPSIGVTMYDEFDVQNVTSWYLMSTQPDNTTLAMPSLSSVLAFYNDAYVNPQLVLLKQPFQSLDATALASMETSELPLDAYIYNTTLEQVQFWSGSTWERVDPGPAPAPVVGRSVASQSDSQQDRSSEKVHMADVLDSTVKDSRAPPFVLKLLQQPEQAIFQISLNPQTPRALSFGCRTLAPSNLRDFNVDRQTGTFSVHGGSATLRVRCTFAIQPRQTKLPITVCANLALRAEESKGNPTAKFQPIVTKASWASNGAPSAQNLILEDLVPVERGDSVRLLFSLDSPQGQQFLVSNVSIVVSPTS